MRFEAWALPANPIALAGSEADAVAQVIALRVKVARGELVDAATDHPHTGGGPVGGVKRTRPLVSAHARLQRSDARAPLQRHGPRGCSGRPRRVKGKLPSLVLSHP